MAEEVRAEMVANVWKVVAAAGQAVAEGDTLVILESMKMEIPVLAEVGGTVSELAVTEGDTLVILESMKMEIPVLAESDGTVAQLAVNEGDVVQEGDLIAVIA